MYNENVHPRKKRKENGLTYDFLYNIFLYLYALYDNFFLPFRFYFIKKILA